MGDAGAGAVSSYAIEDDGSLTTISGSVMNGQTATCWIARPRRGHFAYVTNNAPPDAGGSTISSYRVARDGQLTLQQAVAATSELNPVDLSTTPNGRFLYSINAGSGSIAMFRANPGDGSLVPLGSVGGLPEDDGAVGIAVR